MKNFKLLSMSLILWNILLPAKTTDTTSSNMVAVHLPAIPIHNSYTKKFNVTSISIKYTNPAEKEEKTVTRSTKTVIPAKRGKTFSLKLLVPTSSSKEGVEFGGVSEIKVEGDSISIDPAWISTPELPILIIKDDGGKWSLDKEAMKKAGETAKPKKKASKKSSATKAKTTAKKTTKNTAKKTLASKKTSKAKNSIHPSAKKTATKTANPMHITATKAKKLKK